MLFTNGSRLGSKRSVTISSSNDVTASISYDLKSPDFMARGNAW